MDFAGRSGEDLLDGRERKLAQRLGIELYRDGITAAARSRAKSGGGLDLDDIMAGRVTGRIPQTRLAGWPVTAHLAVYGTPPDFLALLDEGLRRGPRDLNRNCQRMADRWPGSCCSIIDIVETASVAPTCRWVTTYHGDLDQADDMSGTTTDQHAATPSDEEKAVDGLVGQMADLSVVGGEAD